VSASPALNSKEAVRPRHLRICVSIGLLAICGLFVSCNSEQTSTVTPGPTPSQISAGSVQGQATPSGPGAATTKPKPTPSGSGSSATFKHFRVTVSQIARNGSTINVLAKVCVRKLPPDPQGDSTRISWDPWSIRTKSETLHAKLSSSSRQPLYPPDKTYRVGECASGWIPFHTSGSVLKVKYANGVGNVAVWDATNLGKTPQISSSEG
jgi:hypothetical protein